MTIEHEEWVGPAYEAGWDGQRLAIVGFSHWRGDDPDAADATRGVIENACAGHSHAFFDQIVKYFGQESHDALWSRVVFFNYLPDVIGVESERYGWGTSEQHERARARFMRILGERHPDKVLIFSDKAWDSLPALVEQDEGPNPPLPRYGHALPVKFVWATYEVGGHVSKIYRLRHPQGATQEVMKRAVGDILRA